MENKLTCPLCGGKEFKQDKVVLPKYGILRMTDYIADAFICKQCSHIILIEKGSTFFLGVD